MKNFKNVLFIAALVFSGTAGAYVAEEGKVTATLGPTLTKTDFRTTRTGATSPYLGGLGLMVLGDINPRGSLEIAMFFMNKRYLREQAGRFVAEQTQLTHVTMGYRRWLSEDLSVSLSLFSAYSMGEPHLVHSDFPLNSRPDTSATDYTEYGFDLSFQAELWRWATHKAILLDARYSLSLTGKDNERANHYGVMLAFRYLIQKKQKGD